MWPADLDAAYMASFDLRWSYNTRLSSAPSVYHDGGKLARRVRRPVHRVGWRSKVKGQAADHCGFQLRGFRRARGVRPGAAAGDGRRVYQRWQVQRQRAVRGAAGGDSEQEARRLRPICGARLLLPGARECQLRGVHYREARACARRRRRPRRVRRAAALGQAAAARLLNSAPSRIVRQRRRLCVAPPRSRRTFARLRPTRRPTRPTCGRTTSTPARCAHLPAGRRPPAHRVTRPHPAFSLPKPPFPPQLHARWPQHQPGSAKNEEKRPECCLAAAALQALGTARRSGTRPPRLAPDRSCLPPRQLCRHLPRGTCTPAEEPTRPVTRSSPAYGRRSAVHIL